jgi:FkbM family methyltransferase
MSYLTITMIMPLKIREFLKSTFLHDWWTAIRYPEVRRLKARERDFYKRLLPAGSLVFDIGANTGQKTLMFKELGHRIVSVEPDPYNFGLLSRKFIDGKSVVLMNCAVSDKNGESDFFIESPGSAYNTMSDKWKATLEDPDVNRWHAKHEFGQNKLKVKTVTLDHIVSLHGRPYYIKIDVEGYEHMALSGLSTTVPVLSFECNLPEFLEETLQCIEHLHSLDPDATYNLCIDDETFELPESVPFQAFYDLIRQTELRYLEVYCFQKSGLHE